MTSVPAWGTAPDEPIQPAGSITCPYCRIGTGPMDGSTTGRALSCPHCGAPLDIRQSVTRSGWVKQPGITDLARVQFGLPLVMLEAHGPGRIAWSDNHAGDLIALPLAPGQTMWVREHRFVTATGNVSYTWRNTGIWYVTGCCTPR